jgi:hypothetical protein
MLILCFATVLFATLLECSKSPPNQHNLLVVKPFDLFAGESEKFKPFLGDMSGAIKLNYIGSKKSIKAKNVTSAFVEQDSTVSYGTQIEAALKLTANMTIERNKEGQKISEDEETAIWGLQATVQNRMQTVDFTPETS